MQPVSIYMHQGRPFEDAFENTTQWRKADPMNHMGQSKKLLNQKKQKYINFTRRMKVKVYNLVRHTWLKVANNLLMLGLSSFRRKLFDLQAFHNQAHIINLSGIIIYFCGTYYLYAPPPLPKTIFLFGCNRTKPGLVM